MGQVLNRLVAGVALSVFALAAQAQEEGGPNAPARYPETGIPILNCEPDAPAPVDTCFLRMLPGYERQAISDGLEGNNFSLVQPGLTGYPDDIGFSSTLILIDLSPGPGGGRRGTFDIERDLIGDIVRGLPRGERISLYGFNENLQRLTPFSDDREAALAAVEELELQGSNTRIGTFVGDGITILADEENVLMRNLIVISDGQEEGQVGLNNVIEQAIDAEVVISAVGMFWRPVGAEQTSIGMDYLRVLSDGTSGAAAQAILRTGGTAVENVQQFIRSFDDAIASSRLIVPVGTPQETEIRLELGEPALGAPGEFTTRSVVVSYVPLQANSAAQGADTIQSTDPVEPMLFGFPRNYVLGAGGLAAFLVLLALILALRGRRSDDGDLFGDGDEIQNDVPVAPVFEASPTVAVARPAAYLVFDDTNRKVGLSGVKNSVGRSATNDVVIEVNGISRLHAQIFQNRDGGYSVTDMDSLNGTFVNGKKVTGTQTVSPGDALTFGTVNMKLVAAS